MGRVDEALRRAADAARLGSRNGESATPLGLQDAGPELERVVFPEEAPRQAAEAGSATITSRFDLPAVEPEVRPVAPPDPETTRTLVDPKFAQKVVTDAHIVPASKEQYRRLAATLHQAQAARGVRVIMIASAVVGEGKTLTASNLALTLSESYQRTVLLIDADLRRPSVHKVFRTAGAPGLTDGLMADEDRRLSLHQVTQRLTILPAGEPSSDPMAGLTSPRMRRLLDEAREAFTWVIIDTPPVGVLTDASLLASMVDGALLVVHAGSTPHELVKRAIDTIGPDRLLGVVLNRAEVGANGYPYYSYHHYAEPTETKQLR